MSKKWSPQQRAKFMKTLKSKKRQAPTKAAKATHIPLEAIPDMRRPKATQKKMTKRVDIAKKPSAAACFVYAVGLSDDAFIKLASALGVTQ